MPRVPTAARKLGGLMTRAPRRSRCAGRVSVMSRVFSIAMTAWSAKVRTSSICRSVKGSTRDRTRIMPRRCGNERSPPSLAIFAAVTGPPPEICLQAAPLRKLAPCGRMGAWHLPGARRG